MPTRQQEKRLGLASLGLTAASTATAVNTNRIANKINAAHQKRYDKKLKRLEGIYGLNSKGKPVTKIPTKELRDWKPIATTRNISRGTARNYVREGSGQKAAARRKAARIIELGTKRNKVPITPKGRSIIMRTAMVASVPGAIGSRYVLEKNLKRRDMDVAVPAAVAGGAAYQAAGYSLKPYEKKILHRYDDAQNRVAREHKKKMGLPKNAPAGHQAWRQYNLTYPKSLPGWRLKRVIAATHTGPSGVVATGAAGALVGAGAVKLRRKHKEKTVAKNDHQRSAFGVVHEISKVNPIKVVGGAKALRAHNMRAMPTSELLKPMGGPKPTKAMVLKPRADIAATRNPGAQVAVRPKGQLVPVAKPKTSQTYNITSMGKPEPMAAARRTTVKTPKTAKISSPKVKAPKTKKPIPEGTSAVPAALVLGGSAIGAGMAVNRRKEPVGKAKRFDPEQKRLKRTNTYTAMALGGAGVATGAAVIDGGRRAGNAGNLRQMRQARGLARAITSNDTAMRTYLENLKPASRGAEGRRLSQNKVRVANLKGAAKVQRAAALKTAFSNTPNLKRLGAAGGLVAVAGGLQAYKRSDKFQPYQGYRTANRPEKR